jgi:hypothetical protein
MPQFLANIPHNYRRPVKSLSETFIKGNQFFSRSFPGK